MTGTGLVTSRHRRHVIVETESGEAIQCIVRGRQLRPLVGDTVGIDTLKDGTHVVRSVARRRNLLTRIDARGRAEGVAANINQLVAVVATEPAPDWALVDRYFAAAELEDIDGVLVCNKADLGWSSDPRAATYERAGYLVIRTSAKSGLGLEQLRSAFSSHRSVLVGQSGVGKSSLMNCLIGAPAQAVGDLSDKRALGRHTTTAAEMYRLPDGGELIDSPGVRQYAPHLDQPERLDWAFREFRDHLGHCRFDNCRHQAEPDCAVKRAVDTGEISPARYGNYLNLRSTLEELVR